MSRDDKVKYPKELDEDEKTKWLVLPNWKNTFSSTNRDVLLSILRQVFALFTISLILGILFGFILSIFVNSLDKPTVTTLLVGILTVSATILGIIIAFITFWYGSALSGMEAVRASLRAQLNLLDIELDKIRPHCAGPRESVKEPLRGKVEILTKISNEFSEALKTMGGRFKRAADGTYYEGTSMHMLESLIRHLGGEWFKAVAVAFPGHEMHDFGLGVFLQTSSISERIGELNSGIKSLVNRLQRILSFIPVLVTLLMIFVIAVILTIYSSVTDTTSSDFDFFLMTALIVLAVWVLVSLGLLIYLIWRSLSTTYSKYEAHREADIAYTEKLEKRKNFDYATALKRDTEVLLEVLEEDAQSNEIDRDDRSHD